MESIKNINNESNSNINKYKGVDLEKRISKINDKLNSITKIINPSETQFSS
jgi:hypothetical protein